MKEMSPVCVLLTLFQKKEKEKFGQFKNYLYLCTRGCPGFEPLRVYKKQERVSAKRCTRSSVGRAPDS